jgi:peroxiredoxin
MRRALVALALVALAGCGAPVAGPAPAIPEGLAPNVAVRSELAGGGGGLPVVGEQAPDFSYTFADGRAARLSELRGTRVLINFWATWCAPCKEEIPALQQIADERGGELAVLGINKLETLDVIGPFVDELDIRFTLVANPNGDISDRYGAKNIPISYFINSDGTVGAIHLGVMTYDEIRAAVDALR